MKLSPLPGHVFVELIAPKESVFILPTPKEERHTGQIVASAEMKRIKVDCCPDCCPNFQEGMDLVPMEAQVGEYVVFKPRSGDVFQVAGRTFASVHEDDLLASVATLEEFQQLTIPA